MAHPIRIEGDTKFHILITEVLLNGIISFSATPQNSDFILQGIIKQGRITIDHSVNFIGYAARKISCFLDDVEF